MNEPENQNDHAVSAIRKVSIKDWDVDPYKIDEQLGQ